MNTPHWTTISFSLGLLCILPCSAAPAATSTSTDPDRISSVPPFAPPIPITFASPTSFATATRSNLTTPTTVPASCSVSLDVNGMLASTALMGHPVCHTYTSTTTPSSCTPCPNNSSKICPLWIKVSTTTVPCATDCCPSTPTAWVTAAECSSCEDCPVPTQWITETSGCASATATVTDTPASETTATDDVTPTQMETMPSFTDAPGTAAWWWW